MIITYCFIISPQAIGWADKVRPHNINPLNKRSNLKDNFIFFKVEFSLCCLLAKTSYQAVRSSETGNKGAPKLCISKEQLAFLLSCGFNIRRISQLIGVSRNTIKRRMRYMYIQFPPHFGRYINKLELLNYKLFVWCILFVWITMMQHKKQMLL